MSPGDNGDDNDDRGGGADWGDLAPSRQLVQCRLQFLFQIPIRFRLSQDLRRIRNKTTREVKGKRERG